MKRVLVTFLGIGKYQPTNYRLDHQSYNTCYVAEAICKLWEADAVEILATAKAKDVHGEKITRSIESLGITCTIHDIPDGSGEQEQWQLFDVMRTTLESLSDSNIAVDITHGFRAQPFFASSVISLLRATERGCDHLRLFYGEFQQGEDVSPIWDLTLFVDLIDWVQALRIFLRTGRADSLNELAGRQEASIRKEHFQSGGTSADMPNLKPLVHAVRQFAGDLATNRIASMLLGISENATKPGTPSAGKLLKAIETCSADVQKMMPPLAVILEDMQAMVQPLCGVTSLADAQGHKSMLALARLYLRFGRYGEAATVVREGMICLHGDSKACDIGRGFSERERYKAEKAWQDADVQGMKQIADIRNDIAHAGFRQQPQSGDGLKQRVKNLVDCFENYAITSVQIETRPNVLFVSRHRGAVAWAAAQGIHVDRQVMHLNPDDVRAGDTVIGSLPVHLAAAVCGLGARYINLSLDMPRELRGKELSVDDMIRCHARLEEFQVRTAA